MAAVQLGEIWGDMARGIATVTRNPARAVHLEDRGEESGLSIEDLIADIADTSINAVTTVASEVAGFKSPVGRRPTPEGSTANEDQELRFSQLRPFVDYLEMLRDVLNAPGRGSKHVRIHVSTMTRAIETAEIVAAQLPEGSYEKLPPSPLLVEGSPPAHNLPEPLYRYPQHGSHPRIAACP